MAVELDPEGNEINALLQFVDDIKAKNVLEVGCGDGRLTWRYATIADAVTGIDPRTSRIDSAIESIPADLREKVFFHPLSLEDYIKIEMISPTARDFDLVLLSWSL